MEILQPELLQENLNTLVAAACFHDLGIRTHDTLDYLPPSIESAKKWIEQHALDNSPEKITMIIDNHHKITSHKDPLTELFRKADWIDVTWGVLRFGLSRKQINSIYSIFPDNGFHKRLTQLSFRELLRHPLRPVPIFRW